MTVKFYNKRIVLWMILMITPLVSFCLDEYAPSLPHMAAYFQVNSGSVQLSMTIYILALGVSQWAFGFLSDRYGRRPIFNIGMCIAILGTVICGLDPPVFRQRIDKHILRAF